jgi:hypothetical protein
MNERPADAPTGEDLTTEEALPGVDLEPNDEDERRARQTLGPEAASPDDDEREPHDGEEPKQEPHDGER